MRKVRKRGGRGNLAAFGFDVWQRVSRIFFCPLQMGVIFLPVAFLKEESFDVAP